MCWKVNEDRLLVVASAEVELRVFELCWLADNEIEDSVDFLNPSNESLSKHPNVSSTSQHRLVGNNLLAEQSDQANVSSVLFLKFKFLFNCLGDFTLQKTRYIDKAEQR